MPSKRVKTKKANRFAVQPKRVAVIYARYSPKPSEECRTIDAQYGACEEYCKFQGWTVVRKFADERASGTGTLERHEFLKALEFCKEHKAVLICYKLNRMARNTYDALLTLDDLRKHGCDMVLLDILTDTTTPAGRMLFTVMAALSELQAGEVSEVTSEAMQRHQQNLYVMGSTCPYGWKRSGEYDMVKFTGTHTKQRWKMIPDEKEQEVLDLAIRLDARGWGVRKITRYIGLCGYKSRTNQPFHPSTILRILMREKAGLNPARLTMNAKYLLKIGAILPPEYEALGLDATDESVGSDAVPGAVGSDQDATALDP